MSIGSVQKYTAVHLCTRLNDFLLDVRCRRGHHWATRDCQQRGGMNTHRRRDKPEMRPGRTDNSSSNLRVRRQLYSGMSISCFRLTGLYLSTPVRVNIRGCKEGTSAVASISTFLDDDGQFSAIVFPLLISTPRGPAPPRCRSRSDYTQPPVIAVLLEESGTRTHL